MQTITLKLKKRSYKIVVGSNILNKLGKFLHDIKIGKDAYIITNPFIKRKFGQDLSKILKKSGYSIRFKTVADTEESKSIETIASVIKDLAKYDKKRQLFIVAFGGGVIGDLSGFVAAVYKRGVPYLQIPTTLLAQVDSSIGGKTAVDLKEGKNLLGAFYQPKLVLSDVKFIQTLDAKQLASGLAEVIKYGVIKDRTLFYFLEKNYKAILRRNPTPLKFVIGRSAAIKAKIVERDEREEKGIRTILNFGHTVGHAIEASCGYKKYTHGQAIALGMLVAASISVRLRLINNNLLERIEGLVKSVGLPTKIKGASLDKIISSHYHDKKFIGCTNRFVLIKSLGSTKIVRNIPLEVIKQELRKRI